MGVIPISPLRRGTTLSSILPAALGIQESVLFHCLACPPATSTPLLALERLILTPRIQIRPWALQRFCLTPRARKTQLSERPRSNLTMRESTTRPMEHWHFSATPLATATRPAVIPRSPATPQVASTRPKVIKLFIQTPKAMQTRLSGLQRASLLQQAISTPVSATAPVAMSPLPITLFVWATARTVRTLATELIFQISVSLHRHPLAVSSLLRSG